LDFIKKLVKEFKEKKVECLKGSWGIVFYPRTLSKNLIGQSLFYLLLNVKNLRELRK